MALGTPGTTPNSTLDSGAFTACAPSLRTNIRQCGTVTQMNASPLNSNELDAYMKSADFRVMEALFHHDMEIRMCEAVQNGLYDFMMAQKVNLSRKLTTTRLNSGMLDVAPFVMARQFSPINNEYWAVTGGEANAQYSDTIWGASEWKVTVASTTNIPADANFFPVGQRVWMQGKTEGGSATRTQWVVIKVDDSSAPTSIDLYLRGQNAGSKLLPNMGDKLGHPTTGLLEIGTPNVNEFEEFCTEAPTHLNWKDKPFWIEATRDSQCRSSLYEKWHMLVLQDNALYKEYFDLPEIEKNKQLGQQWQRRLVRQMFWGKAIDGNQNLADYRDLPEIAAMDLSTYGLGVDGGAVVGRRANAIGIYEQHAECDRVVDCLGEQLNLPALFAELYNMYRVRKANGTAKPDVFDMFTDSVTAELINQAMILYFKDKSGSQLQYTSPADGQPKTAAFNFNYRSYKLFWPAVQINVISHDFFDDWRSAGISAIGADDNTTRVLWVLDFSGIYPGIISTKRTVYTTGDHKTLAAVSSRAACVQTMPTREETLTGMVWTMICECTVGNLILENFSGDVPEYKTLRGTYPASNTTTTSSTPFGF